MSLVQFAGAETGGLEELTLTFGSITASSAIKRTGTYSYRLPTGSSFFRLAPQVTGGDRTVGGGFYLTTLPSGSTDILVADVDTGGTFHASVRISPSGDIVLFDATNTAVGTYVAGLVANTWYYIEVFFPYSDSGTAKVLLDGKEILSVTGDFANVSVSLHTVEWESPAGSGGGVTHWDDCYQIDNFGTGAWYGPSQVLPYQPGNTTATSDEGNNLDTGVWNNVGKTPAETATTRTSFTGNPDGGSVFFNDAASGGHGPGPSGGAYPVIGIIQQANYIFQLFRGTGSATNHHIRVGSDVGGVTTLNVTLTTSPAIYQQLRLGGIPTATQVFAAGFDTGGAQDILCDEMWCMLLHTPSIPGYMQGRPNGAIGARQMAQLIAT